MTNNNPYVANPSDFEQALDAIGFAKVTRKYLQEEQGFKDVNSFKVITNNDLHTLLKNMNNLP